ncbi:MULTISPECIES: S8 family serine peptidase [unclassified Amycolatopsis]|uniref:S8 family serine peptidase n=1 Tax=unclassified Amycolatopsis TaxID=2618356 RepID=UPI002874820B|nr:MULTISPECIES: S8 family serine peptidase [unclassified Amycolatopsis]MDS0134291.1 S8 family serine peptidase [Amycolatopsis sp. 505]MDS0149610.1 S8 family serine peptidase [Amycolatopsis sp. CM201R]
MKVKYHPPGRPAGPQDVDAPLPEWPQHILDRHRARILRPAEARRGTVDNLRSTAYRADVLLICQNALDTKWQDFSAVLDGTGMALQEPPELDDIVTNSVLRERLSDSRLPRAVRLVEGGGEDPADAWVALQLIRQQRPDLAGDVSLDHLMCGSVLGYGGVPTYDPNGVGHDAADGSPGSRYGLAPVTFSGAPPHRSPDGATRRPVIAVLDTGVRSHPWWGDVEVLEQPGTGGFLRLFKPAQDAIDAQHQHVAGLPDGDALQTYIDAPIWQAGLGEYLNYASGHGSFIAGIIHQNAPDADVLSMRVMHSDGTSWESDVLLALHLILALVTDAQAKHDDRPMVDIVSLSLGFYDESDGADSTGGANITVTDGKVVRLAEVIGELTDQGVLVVAAAGNDTTTRPFLPAAFATLPTGSAGHGEPVLGVGALNPNGTTAWFSNGGPSATWYAPGARIVSAFPPDIRGAGAPGRIGSDNDRQGLDPDDFSGGFAVWDGTSFAAPHIAAALAREIETEIKAGNTDAGKRASEAVRRLKQIARTQAEAEANARPEAGLHTREPDE